MFIAVALVQSSLQAVFVEFGGSFFKTSGLTPIHWGVSIGLAALTIPVGALSRCLPVPTRDSDWASTYSRFFAERMRHRQQRETALRFVPPLQLTEQAHDATSASHHSGANVL